MAVDPQPAATIVLLAAQPYSVLMVKRPPGGLFGDAWVFPGGLVDPTDGEGEAGCRAAAVRELSEEVAVGVEPARLAYLSRWITPESLPRRYDTWFFLAALDQPVAVAPVTDEIVSACFVSPLTALAAHAAQHWKLVLPTLAHLQWLARHRTAAEALAAADGQSRKPVEPSVASDGSVVVDIPW